jgi:hypothetical protein
LKPICASNKAANKPQGPKPTTRGLALLHAGFIAHRDVDDIDKQDHAVFLARVKEDAERLEWRRAL